MSRNTIEVGVANKKYSYRICLPQVLFAPSRFTDAIRHHTPWAWAPRYSWCFPHFLMSMQRLNVRSVICDLIIYCVCPPARLRSTQHAWKVARFSGKAACPKQHLNERGMGSTRLRKNPPKHTVSLYVPKHHPSSRTWAPRVLTSEKGKFIGTLCFRRPNGLVIFREPTPKAGLYLLGL